MPLSVLNVLIKNTNITSWYVINIEMEIIHAMQ